MFHRHSALEDRAGAALPLFVDELRDAEQLYVREPTNAELAAIEAEITGHHWDTPTVTETHRCGHPDDGIPAAAYGYPPMPL